MRSAGGPGWIRRRATSRRQPLVQHIRRDPSPAFSLLISPCEAPAAAARTKETRPMGPVRSASGQAQRSEYSLDLRGPVHSVVRAGNPVRRRDAEAVPPRRLEGILVGCIVANVNGEGRDPTALDARTDPL